jgi:oxygen-dependent protoporphyrinogen oxidase
VPSAPRTIVLGAGISGLSCAYALKKAGEDVLLLEAAPCPGGVIRTVRENGFLCELGPQSFAGAPPLFELCDQLGISAELVEAPRRTPRYISLNGKLVPVPLSPGAFLSTRLLSWRTKRSILCEPFRTSHPPADDESVAAFIQRKFTSELLDRLVGPFVSGIYAGDPEKLSLRAAFPKLYQAEKLSGSLIRGGFRLAKKKAPAPKSARRSGLYSFRNGNQTLIDSLAAALGSSLRCGMRSTIAHTGSGFRLSVDSPAGSESIDAENLVLATPAHVSAYLLGAIAPNAAWPAFDLPYAQVSVVSHGYQTRQVGADLQGFGFLIPRTEKFRTLGCVWNSSLFPGRAPADHVLFTSFIGGATQSPLPEEEAARAVREEISKILRISGDPVLQRVTGYSAAIPQYNLGHGQTLQAIRDAVSGVPGLWVIGNYWNGPAIGACIEHSLSVAQAIRIG